MIANLLLKKFFIKSVNVNNKYVCSWSCVTKMKKIFAFQRKGIIFTSIFFLKSRLPVGELL